MKQKRTPRSYKKALLLVTCAVIVAGVTVAILEATNTINLFGHTKQFTATQKQEASTDAQKKKQAIENDPSKKGTPPVTTPPTPSDISITAHQENDGTITISSKLAGYSGGTCSLSITNGIKTFTQTVAVIYQTEFSTCAGFSVPIDTVGTGHWSITVSAVLGSTTNHATTTLEVR